MARSLGLVTVQAELQSGTMPPEGCRYTVPARLNGGCDAHALQTLPPLRAKFVETAFAYVVAGGTA
jgi:hypothetical protein